MLYVIEYFAKSLKVIRNDSLEWDVCKYSIVTTVSRAVSETFSVK